MYGVVPKGSFDVPTIRTTILGAMEQRNRERRGRDVQKLQDTVTLIGAERRRRLEAFRKAL